MTGFVRLAAVAAAAVILLAAAGDAAASRWDRLLAPAGACAHADSRAARADRQETAMRCLINWARRKAGRHALRPSGLLARSSDLKDRQLLRCQRFEHAPCRGQDAFSVFREVRYMTRNRPASVGENIAWGTSYLAKPRQIMRAWLNSPGHRRNVLRAGWREQGVALRVGPFLGHPKVAVWTSHFGRR